MELLGYGCTSSSRLFKLVRDDTGRRRSLLMPVPLTLTVRDDQELFTLWASFTKGHQKGVAEALRKRDRLISGAREWMTLDEIQEATGGRLSKTHILRICREQEVIRRQEMQELASG